MTTNDNFYVGYRAEKGGEELERLENEADKIAEEIDNLEFDLEDSDNFNNSDVIRLAKLKEQLTLLEDKITSIIYVY